MEQKSMEEDQETVIDKKKEKFWRMAGKENKYLQKKTL